eukprot:2092704-Rhodomonas_salina.3
MLTARMLSWPCPKLSPERSTKAVLRNRLGENRKKSTWSRGQVRRKRKKNISTESDRQTYRDGVLPEEALRSGCLRRKVAQDALGQVELRGPGIVQLGKPGAASASLCGGTRVSKTSGRTKQMVSAAAAARVYFQARETRQQESDVLAADLHGSALLERELLEALEEGGVIAPIRIASAHAAVGSSLILRQSAKLAELQVRLIGKVSEGASRQIKVLEARLEEASALSSRHLHASAELLLVASLGGAAHAGATH